MVRGMDIVEGTQLVMRVDAITVELGQSAYMKTIMTIRLLARHNCTG